MMRYALLLLLLLLSTAARADFEPRGQYAEINGLKMYYEVSGEGDPIVVLHGAYMSIPAMGEIIPLLAKTRRVYAVEMQGHGRTNDIDRPLSYPQLADDIAALMDHVNLPRADVFGYSMGAAVGLHLAARHPKKVDRLVAASTAYDLKGMQPRYLELVPTMTPNMFIGTPIETDWKKLAPNPNGFEAFVSRMIELERQPVEWESEVKSLQAPVLLIAGDADVVTLEHMVDMFRLLGGGVMGDMQEPLPESRLAILPATSHTAIINQPALVHAITEPFLKDETPKGMFDP